mmetsp:Transcript_39433/g.131575  ORF Transcript_39433/g.131575 Transcript_39433/m.131575 type:complete len:362 (+) Transcript_39433:83-1168(+)
MHTERTWRAAVILARRPRLSRLARRSTYTQEARRTDRLADGHMHVKTAVRERRGPVVSPPRSLAARERAYLLALLYLSLSPLSAPSGRSWKRTQAGASTTKRGWLPHVDRHRAFRLSTCPSFAPAASRCARALASPRQGSHRAACGSPPRGTQTLQSRGGRTRRAHSASTRGAGCGCASSGARPARLGPRRGRSAPRLGLRGGRSGRATSSACDPPAASARLAAAAARTSPRCFAARARQVSVRRRAPVSRRRRRRSRRETRCRRTQRVSPRPSSRPSPSAPPRLHRTTRLPPQPRASPARWERCPSSGAAAPPPPPQRGGTCPSSGAARPPPPPRQPRRAAEPLLRPRLPTPPLRPPPPP